MPKKIQGSYEATGRAMLENILIWIIATICFFLGLYCGIKIERD